MNVNTKWSAILIYPDAGDDVTLSLRERDGVRGKVTFEWTAGIAFALKPKYEITEHIK